MSQPRLPDRLPKKVLRGLHRLLLAGALAGVASSDSAAQSPSAPSIEEDLCAAIMVTGSETICLPLTNRPWTLWVGTSDCSLLRWEVDGQDLRPTWESVEGGCRYQWEPTKVGSGTSSRLTLTNTSSRQLLWTLSLDRTLAEILPWRWKVAKRNDLNLAQLKPKLLGIINEPQSPGIFILDAKYALGLVYQKSGDRNDDAQGVFIDLSQDGDRRGFPSISIEALIRAASVSLDAGHPASALDLITRARQVKISHYDKTVNWLNYYEGLAYRNMANLKLSKPPLELALAKAKRLGDFEMIQMAAPLLADVLISMGEQGMADSIIDTLPSYLTRASPNQAIHLMAWEAWLRLRSAEPSHKFGTPVEYRGVYVRPLFEETLKLRRARQSNLHLANILAGLAEVNFLEGNIERAQQYLKAAQAIPGIYPEDAIILHDLEGRIGLHHREWQIAKEAYSVMEESSQNFNTLDRLIYHCRAVLGQMLANQGLGEAYTTLSSEVQSCFDRRSNGLPSIEFKLLQKRLSPTTSP